MTLSQRTILIIISTFFALLFILATTSDYIILSSYSALEKAGITSQATHISNRIIDKLKQLDETAEEISGRAEGTTIKPENSENEPGKLFSEHFLRSHSIDIAALYDKSGRLAAIGGFDCENDRLCPVSIEHKQALDRAVSRFRASSNSVAHGVVNLDGLPFMVSMRRIGDSGTEQGFVAIGWFIDKFEIEQTFRASGVSIEVFDLKSSLTPDVRRASSFLVSGGNGGFFASVFNATSVAAYFMLKDTFGAPSFIVRIIEKRILYEQGKTTLVYIFTSLALAGGSFCVVMLVFMRRAVLARLQSLTALVRQIAEMRNRSARLPESKYNDELKMLADSINSMLESLERSEDAVRESEGRYRMLFEQAPDAIIIIGLEGEEAGRVVAANFAAADQHGYTVSELCSLSIRDLNTEESNAVADDLTSRIASGEWVTTELWHLKKDGTRLPLEVHAGLVHMKGKKYILGFDRDITHRKIAEQTDRMRLEQISRLNDELSRKALDLEAANTDLEIFNYSVSHDMRGPLTRISGYCQLLLDDDYVLEPDVREYISRIYESEIWLNDMIDALLHLAQLNRVEIVSGSVNLSNIAETLLKELAYEHPERSVRICIAPDVVASGDQRLLKMALINLLDNAWKYSSHKSDALIEFGVEMYETGPVYFVRDNGVGFDMKSADKLFRVFSRLHDSNQFSGTGIGLATVQRIIFRHGGLIWVEAELDAGATFYFTLP